jgi:hypothetical protein
MSSGVVVTIALIPIVSGAVLIWLGFRAVSRYWLITHTPRSRIRGIAMGLVEIYGWAYGKPPLRAPFSGKECVYYRYEVDEYQHQGKTTDWVTVNHGSRSGPMLVVDFTGEVWVNTAGAEFTVDLRRAYAQKSGSYGGGRLAESFSRWLSGKPAEKRRHQLVPLHQYRGSSWGDAIGDRRYYEYSIDVGNPVYVMGTAVPSRTAPGGMVICKGSDEPTFIIGSKRGWGWADHRMEKDMASPLRLNAAAYIATGAVCVFIGALFYFWVTATFL